MKSRPELGASFLLLVPHPRHQRSSCQSAPSSSVVHHRAGSLHLHPPPVRSNQHAPSSESSSGILLWIVFYIATNSELNVSRFTEMHYAHTVVQSHCLELEAELSKLCDKVQKDDHTELVKRFSNLEVNYLNLQLKYQNLKERFGNNTSPPARDAPDFDSVFVIEKIKASIQGKDNAIKKLRMQISQLKETRSEADRTLDFRALDFQITQLTEKVTALQEQNEFFRVENAKIKQHYKELYQRRNQQYQAVLVSLPTSPENQAIAASMQSAIAYANQQEPDQNWGSNFPNSPSLSVFKCKSYKSSFVRFRNAHFGAIMGYGDYVIGDSLIYRHSCYVRDTNDVELIKGSCSSNLYTIPVEDMMKSSPICVLSKAFKNKSWLWHRRLNHLNFGNINDLARKDLVRGLPRLKFEKEHLCFACQLGKSKKHTHSPKTENTNLEVLNTLYMNLCGPILKDETPEFVIKILKQIQVGLEKTVRYIRTDNGTEFVNQVLTQYYESVGIFHKKSVPRTPQQNGVVKRRNRTLVEAARTMLVFFKALMFLWAEAVATACYTKIDPSFTLVITKPHMSWCMIRSMILPFSESLVLFVTLQMTARILENYNQQLILEFSLVMHQVGRVIESKTKEPDES
ncbi:retrovirus-related pol polyprotein from transposon TNT 1-94 [Tanacetum coccineum]